MSNHSSDYDPKMQEMLQKMQRTVEDAEAGATGRFPRGKITPHDEGEIALRVAHKDGTIIIDFGKPVTWIGFDEERVRGFAALLLKHADAVKASG